MKIKHSQIRALVKFAGIVVFSFSLYQKLKQIFIYGGTVANLPTEPVIEVSPIAMANTSEGEYISKYIEDSSEDCGEDCGDIFEEPEYEQEQGG